MTISSKTLFEQAGQFGVSERDMARGLPFGQCSDDFPQSNVSLPQGKQAPVDVDAFLLSLGVFDSAVDFLRTSQVHQDQLACEDFEFFIVEGLQLNCEDGVGPT